MFLDCKYIYIYIVTTPKQSVILFKILFHLLESHFWEISFLEVRPCPFSEISVIINLSGDLILVIGSF